jgi:hypothetical protein
VKPLTEHEMSGMTDRVWAKYMRPMDKLALLWIAWNYGDDGISKGSLAYLLSCNMCITEARAQEVLDALVEGGVLVDHPDGDGRTWMVTL